MLPSSGDHKRVDAVAADGLARAAPSAVGVDAGRVQAFLDDVEAAGLDLHSLMLHRQGHVAVEAFWWPYRADRLRVMHSVAKSFTACAIGMALEEGRLALGDTVISFFPEHAPKAADAKLAAMTIEDLLTMRTGHAEETSGAIWRGIKTSWIAEFFKIPVAHQPGTVYVYTSAASYMLSAILTKVTGQTLHDYLRPRLFEPLGITGETWDVGPDGVNPGGNGLTCKTVDLLKLGILQAQKGVWEGRRLLSEDWIERATRAYGEGYGYHWVVGEHGAFGALGVFVQLMLVFPQAGATVAITAGISSSKRILPILYRHFPAAFPDEALDGAADAALAARLTRTAQVPPLVSQAEPAPEHAGDLSYAIAKNALGVKALRLEFGDGACRMTLTDADGDHSIQAGVNRWIDGSTDMPGRELHHGYALSPAKVVAGARWLDADTLEMTWIFVETAFRDTVVCRFHRDRISLSRRVNVNSASLDWPDLAGHQVRG
jgi:CubicO group peptidase (beta-lactamase class C family)